MKERKKSEDHSILVCFLSLSDKAQEEKKKIYIHNCVCVFVFFPLRLAFGPLRESSFPPLLTGSPALLWQRLGGLALPLQRAERHGSVEAEVRVPRAGRVGNRR